MESFSLAKEDTVWTYLRTVANKKRTFEDPLYKEGNDACKMQLQYVALDEDEDNVTGKSESVSQFQCEVPGCGRWLGSVYEQEVHYSTSHRHSCSLCRTQLPSFHMLQLHLEENHDSLFQLRAERQPMYCCLLESCEVRSADPVSRRQHCVTQHCFPTDFCYSARPPAAALPGPPADVPGPPADVQGPPAAVPGPPAAVSGRPRRLRFSYGVPEQGVSFGVGAVPSLGRGAAGGGAEIDMASLAAALQQEPL